MSTPSSGRIPNGGSDAFRKSQPQGQSQGQGDRPRSGGGGNTYSFQYNRSRTNVRGAGGGAGQGRAGGGLGAGGAGRGGAQGGGQGAGGRVHSPLGDPDFFTNADIRRYCETGRQAFVQLSFELMIAAEVLSEVLKEVPDADGRPFGSQMRARRVSKHMKKAADQLKDAAGEIARTYAAFQREYDPELSRVGRTYRPPRRAFDFNN